MPDNKSDFREPKFEDKQFIENIKNSPESALVGLHWAQKIINITLDAVKTNEKIPHLGLKVIALLRQDRPTINDFASSVDSSGMIHVGRAYMYHQQRPIPISPKLGEFNTRIIQEFFDIFTKLETVQLDSGFTLAPTSIETTIAKVVESSGLEANYIKAVMGVYFNSFTLDNDPIVDLRGTPWGNNFGVRRNIGESYGEWLRELHPHVVKLLKSLEEGIHPLSKNHESTVIRAGGFIREKFIWEQNKRGSLADFGCSPNDPITYAFYNLNVLLDLPYLLLQYAEVLGEERTDQIKKDAISKELFQCITGETYDEQTVLKTLFKENPIPPELLIQFSLFWIDKGYEAINNFLEDFRFPPVAVVQMQLKTLIETLERMVKFSKEA